MPSSRLAAVQNFFSVTLACPKTRCCSQYLVTKMYQVPSDIAARMKRTPCDTASPVYHRATIPYGFSTVAVCSATAGAGAPAAGAAASAGAVAAGGGGAF